MNRTLFAGLLVAGAVTSAMAAYALTGANPALITASAANIPKDSPAKVIGVLANRPDLTDGPVANGHLFVTHNWNPTGATGTYFPHAVGFTNTDKFAIVALNNTKQIPGVAYNTLFVIDGTPNAFFWRATKASVSMGSANSTFIDHPACNGKPNARLTVTPNLTTRNKIPGVINPHNIGVWYSNGKWAIFNQDMAPMPENASFSVYVDISYGATVVAKAGVNIQNNSVLIKNIPALSGGNRNVRLVVTPVWNPGGVGGVYNNHPIGVWYTGTEWAIYNEDMAAMPNGAAFNVEWDTNQSTPG